MGDGTFWGADTVNPLNNLSYCGGGSCDDRYFATYAVNHTVLASSPHNTIRFWGRYFRNAGSSTVEWQGNGEATALQQAQAQNSALGSNRNGWILPIDTPTQSQVNAGTYAEGVTEANDVLAKLATALNNDADLNLPGSEILYVYLDWEDDTGAFSGPFYDGWSETIEFYEYPSDSSNFPFYAALYVTNTGGTNGNNACVSANDAGILNNIWSTQNEPNCDSPGPAWGGSGKP
jgi:hypothetical protein